MKQSILNFRNSQKAQTIVTFVLLLIIAVFLVYYLIEHPSIWQKVTELSLIDFLSILALYGVFFIALAIVLYYSVIFCGKVLGVRETVLLNAYSSLTNFFGPGQSGPGVRALYLKGKLGLHIKSFIFVSLIYYAFYAILSAIMLFSAVRPWWLAILLTVGVVGVCAGVLGFYGRKQQSGPKNVVLLSLIGILIGTILQMIAQVAIYAVELQSISVNATLGQVISYTGAANFSLFVSLTPGAIGIRESFLIFSESLHHISNTNIISAGVIDRAVYVVFLGIVFLLIITLHAKGKFDTFRQGKPSSTDR